MEIPGRVMCVRFHNNGRHCLVDIDVLLPHSCCGETHFYSLSVCEGFHEHNEMDKLLSVKSQRREFNLAV